MIKRRTTRKKARRSSEVLMNIAQDKSLKNNLTYKKLLQQLGTRSIGIALLLFALPSALPLSIVPGFSVIFSLPIIFFALQMIIGAKSVWMPKFIGNKEVSHEKLSLVIKKTLPYVKKLERLFVPRLLFMNSRISAVFSGIIILLLAILLILPIPFSNSIIACLIIILSLGMTQKDGLVILVGYFFITIFIFFYYMVLFSAVKAFF